MTVYLLDLRAADSSIPVPEGGGSFFIESNSWYGARQIAIRIFPLESIEFLGRALKALEDPSGGFTVCYENPENRTEVLQRTWVRAVPPSPGKLNGKASAVKPKSRRRP